MAKEFAQFDATDTTLKPSDLGFTARETAGRRIGPFYTEMAQATREVANMQKENFDQMGKNLEAFLRFKSLEDKGGGGGGGLRGGGRTSNDLIGTGSGTTFTDTWAGRVDPAIMGEVSNGGRMMSRLSRNLVGQSSPYRAWKPPGPEELAYEKKRAADAAFQKQVDAYNKRQAEEATGLTKYQPPEVQEMRNLTDAVNQWDSLDDKEKVKLINEGKVPFLASDAYTDKNNVVHSGQTFDGNYVDTGTPSPQTPTSEMRSSDPSSVSYFQPNLNGDIFSGNSSGAANQAPETPNSAGGYGAAPITSGPTFWTDATGGM